MCRRGSTRRLGAGLARPTDSNSIGRWAERKILRPTALAQMRRRAGAHLGGELFENYIDADHDFVPESELKGFVPVWAVVRTVGNNTRDLVALVSDGNDDVIEAMLKNGQGLSLIRL